MTDTFIVKLKQRVIIHQNVAAAGFVFQLFHFRTQLLVIAEKGVTGLPVAFHQRVTDKQFATQRRIDLAVIHFTRRDDGQPVNGDFFRRHDRALRPFPVRLAVAALKQVLRYRLNPLGVDSRRNASPQAAGFHQFGDDGPLGRFFKETGTGENREPGVTRAGKFLLISIFHTDVRQQPGQ